MFRKIVLAFAALALIGTAAFTVAAVPASANSYHSYRHHHYVWRPAVRYAAPAYGYAAPAYDSCYVRRVVHTAFGPRVQWTNVCY